MKTKIRVMILIGAMLVALVLGMTGTVKMINGSVNDPAIPMDCLIGVFVTKDYLDLYEGFDPADDEVGKLGNANDTARLYATIVETPFTNRETGETDVVKQYVFEGIEGMRFLYPKMQSSSDSYREQTVDEAFSDVHFHIHVTDDSESISLKGTIYITSDVSFDTLYFNPVYQSDAGDVYVVSGDAAVGLDEGFIPGTSMTTKVNATRTKTMEDSEVSDTAEVEVTVSYMDKPTGIAILQFDGDDQLLLRDEYAPETLPETLAMQPGTQYVVIETTTASEDPSASVMRDIFQRSDESFEAFFCRDDGLCVKQSCDIDWND